MTSAVRFIVALLALLAPLALAAALLAIPADEARAHSEHPGFLISDWLHCAAGINGDLAAVVHLLEMGHFGGSLYHVNRADCNSCDYSCGGGNQDGNGHTPLHQAAIYGRATIVATLIAAGADVNAKNNWNETPLHRAVIHGRAAVVATLIAAGADVNAKTPIGDTPLRLARHYNGSIIPVLIAAGGYWDQPCVGLATVNPAGPTSPCLCESPNVGPANKFPYCQAPSAQACGRLTPPQFFDETRVSITAGECVPFNPCAGGTLDRETNTCECAAPAVLDGAGNNCECLAPNLDFAVGDCRAPSVENCAEYYTSPRFHFPRFYSPTLSACASHDECIAVRDCTHAPVEHGLYESHWAAAITMNSYEVVSHLIADHGRNPEDSYRENAFPRTYTRLPLHRAAQLDADQAALALIEGGADVNRVYRGDTPLHWAVPSFKTVKLLLQRGANPDAKRGNYGYTALHHVAGLSDTAENVALVSLLLDKGADPNIRSRLDGRPLDVAFGKDTSRPPHRKVMAALIAWGGTWSEECPGGAIPNENHEPDHAIPRCVCPPHISERNSQRCECPADSHAQVNGRCLAKNSAQALQLEIAKMRLELERLRLELAKLNLQLSLAADGPPEMLEEVAKQAEVAARGIARRRDNILALARADLAEAADAGPAPTLALSDTEATCRMLAGEVQTHSRTGAKICSEIDHNDTFCIVEAASAFPCVGFFRHVRRCNDDHNRPALDPWHCAKQCADGLRARGAKCKAD